MGLAWPIGTIAVVGAVVALIGIVGGHIAGKREQTAKGKPASGKPEQKQTAARNRTEELAART
jgi:hypothetical protein